MIPIKKLLKSAVDSEEIHIAAEANRILKYWPSIVGPIMNQKSRPDRYERGTVWVAVSSSEWAQELRLRQNLILKRLQAYTKKADMFQQIRFGVRDFEPIEIEENEEPPPKETDTRSFQQIIDDRRKKLGLIPPSEEMKR